MRNLQPLEILILELICKHPSINNTYTLERFFAKSSILPDKLYTALDDLLTQEYAAVREKKNTLEYYEITTKGKASLDEIDVFGIVEGFTREIDSSGFIANIVFLMENKGNLVEIVDCYLLSDGRMIGFINADYGKLADGTTLENIQKRKWRIKQFVQVWGSTETYEIVEQKEKDNTFQYFLEGVGHMDNPEKGEMLKRTSNNGNLAL